MLMLTPKHEPRLAVRLTLPAARTLLWLLDRMPLHAPPGADLERVLAMKKELFPTLVEYLDADLLYTLGDALDLAGDEQRIVDQLEVKP